MVLLQAGIERKTMDASYIYTLISQNCLKVGEVFVSTTIVGNSLRLFALQEEKCAMGSNAQKLFKVPKTEEELKREKEDKFAGAFVLYPQHAKSTGFELLGQASRYIHNFCIDYDIGSEYPTAMTVMNCCNETMVGKVVLDDPDSIDIPLYENMYMIDEDDQKNYYKTANVSNLMMEGLSEDNPTEFGRQYFKLPTFTDIADYIEENMDEFI